jgi:F-type H+-transporting ATPase subunit b
VYRPLLNVIDKRRERIARSMEDVKSIDEQKVRMEEFRQEQMKKMDAEAGAFLEKARKEAEEAKKQILASAHEEAQQMLRRGEEKLTEERTRVLAEVQGTVAKVIVAATEKILEREFTPADQKRMLDGLTKQLTADLR